MKIESESEKKIYLISRKVIFRHMIWKWRMDERTVKPRAEKNHLHFFMILVNRPSIHKNIQNRI